MEGPLRLLLLAGLLAALVPAAAATFGPQPGEPCEPSLLATQVSFLCAAGPTVECCDTVLAAAITVDGFPCLYRIAADPQLVAAGIYASHLIAMYTSCGGLRPADAHLATDIYHAPAPPTAGITVPPPSHGTPRNLQSRNLIESVCQEDLMILARLLVSACGETVDPFPSPVCCRWILHTIDRSCLCAVGEEPLIVASILDSVRMWSLYKACEGKGSVPLDMSECTQPQSPPPPPPPRQSPASPTSPIEHLPSSVVDSRKSMRDALSVVGIPLGSVIVGLALGAIIGAIIVHIRRKVRSRPAPRAAPLREPPASEDNTAVAKAPVGELKFINRPLEATNPIHRTRQIELSNIFREPAIPAPSAPPESLMTA